MQTPNPANPPPATSASDHTSYAGRPVEYVREILHITPTPDQEAILRAIHEPPCRVLVPSATNTGKTHCAAALTNYWFDSFNPGIVLTTAPTERDVVDLLWAEVRLQRARAGLPDYFIGSSAPEMGDSPEHYAKGFTARLGLTFKGRHHPRMLFIIDEATQVARSYFGLIRTMFDPTLGHAELVMFNPDDDDSAAHDIDLGIDEGKGDWHRFRLSALTHPNILAQLQLRDKEVPYAVSLEQVNDAFREGCDRIDERDHTATDILWPPADATAYCARHNVQPQWYRPGMEFDAYIRGLWPQQGDGVWSAALFEACCVVRDVKFPLDTVPQIGCDTAQGKAADWHAIHARWGVVSLRHETSNTMDAPTIAERLKAVCQDMADLATKERGRNGRAVSAKEIPIKIDDDGTGGAIGSYLRNEGYLVRMIGAGTKAGNPEKYPNKRSELWFAARDRARQGLVYLGRLEQDVRRRLRQQLLAPTWKLHGGQRVVESKDVTKGKIGRSPDDADALLLALYDSGPIDVAPVIDTPKRDMTPHAAQSAEQRQTDQRRPPAPQTRNPWGLGHRR